MKLKLALCHVLTHQNFYNLFHWKAQNLQQLFCTFLSSIPLVTFSPFILTLGYKGIKPVINNFFIASAIVIAMYSLEVLRIKNNFPPPAPCI